MIPDGYARHKASPSSPRSNSSVDGEGSSPEDVIGAGSSMEDVLSSVGADDAATGDGQEHPAVGLLASAVRKAVAVRGGGGKRQYQELRRALNDVSKTLRHDRSDHFLRLLPVLKELVREVHNTYAAARMGARKTALAPRMSDPDTRYETKVDLDNDPLLGDHDSFNPATIEGWVAANLGGTIDTLAQSTTVLTTYVGAAHDAERRWGDAEHKYRTHMRVLLRVRASNGQRLLEFMRLAEVAVIKYVHGKWPELAVTQAIASTGLLGDKCEQVVYLAEEHFA